jgi:hypothetical protein
MKAVGAQPAQLPSCITAMPSGTRRRTPQHQRHHHVGGVVGHHARRVRHQDAPLPRGRDVDMVHARAVIRDQLQPVARLPQHARVDPVGDAGHQNIGPVHRATSSGLLIGLSASFSSTSNSSFNRVSTASGNRRVTTTLNRSPAM